VVGLDVCWWCGGVRPAGVGRSIHMIYGLMAPGAAGGLSELRREANGWAERSTRVRRRRSGVICLLVFCFFVFCSSMDSFRGTTRELTLGRLRTRRRRMILALGNGIWVIKLHGSPLDSFCGAFAARGKLRPPPKRPHSNGYGAAAASRRRRGGNKKQFSSHQKSWLWEGPA